MHVEAESLHCLWNSVKLAAKRSGLQGALLLGTLMSNVSHGPFTSGAAQMSKERAAERLSEEMSQGDFEVLQEAMQADFIGEDDSQIPESREDIPNLRSVRSLGQFVWD